jgi:hypothetical protein
MKAMLWWREEGGVWASRGSAKEKVVVDEMLAFPKFHRSAVLRNGGQAESTRGRNDHRGDRDDRSCARPSRVRPVVLIYRCAARTRLTPLIAPHCSDEAIAYFCPPNSCFTTVQPMLKNDSSGLPVGICVTRSVSGAIVNVLTPEIARNPCV